MASMLLTCPESAHLEEVELVVSPAGMLVVRCSAACPLACARTCAARLDKKRMHDTRFMTIIASSDD